MLYGFGRLALVLWLCAVSGQVFTLFAFHNAVAEAHTAEIAARVSALAGQVAGVASERSAIGFPLADLVDLQRQVDQVAAGGGVRLYVVDQRGTVLFGTDQTAVGSPAPAGWLGGTGMVPASPWNHTDEDGVLVGVPVVDALGTAGGAILGHAPQQEARVEVLAALRETASISLIFLIAIAVLATVGTRLFLTDIQKAVASLGAAYAARRRCLDADVPPADADPALAAVLVNLREAEAEASRIDDAPFGAEPA